MALLKGKRILDYVKKGEGAIYFKETDAKGANPLDLGIWAATVHPSYFEVWLNRLKNIAVEELEMLIFNIPDDRMSPPAKEFAIAILKCTTQRLSEITL